MTQFFFSLLILWLGAIPVADLPDQSYAPPDNEHVGQVFIVGFYGTEVTPQFRETLLTYRPGGVLLLGRNIKDAEQLRQLTHNLQEIATEGGRTPLWIAIDQEGGVVSRIKWTIVPDAPATIPYHSKALSIGERRGKELAQLGINMNLAPVLDSRNPKDFLRNRALSANDDQALDVARGLLDGHRVTNVLAVPKHFPGYDGITINPETTVIPRVAATPSAGLFRVMNRFADIIMVSHVIYNDQDSENPFPLSPTSIQSFRKMYGSEPLLMSDDLLSPAFQKQYTIAELTEKSAASGIDLFLLGDPKKAEEFMGVMREQVESDRMRGERFIKIADRVIGIKKRYGLIQP